ncbi:hypothetical protein UCDDS831_g04193 [Diplodia seriata]|uniref:Uncharacterized protein n=1 Tax=Diplodia seriata TaxID=420778 RepID=A0A0G2GDD7_9PEZI|nr:hypothetical protein UCDDS831_g04193 [Diplodia seriata]
MSSHRALRSAGAVPLLSLPSPPPRRRAAPSARPRAPRPAPARRPGGPGRVKKGKKAAPKRRGQPLDGLTAATEEEAEADWRAMRGLPPLPQNDDDDDDDEPAALAQQPPPPKRKRKAEGAPIMPVRASKRIAARRLEASAASTTIPLPSPAAPPAPAAPAALPAPAPAAAPPAAAAPPTPAANALRSRNDPVVGANGFRLLHPQHHFVRGTDQSAHLTMSFTDNTQPGVTQFLRYTPRGPRGGAGVAPAIDWNAAADIAKLNRWTCQVLKRHGAASLRPDVTHFTPGERQWLRDYGRRLESDLTNNGTAVPSREEQARAFNARWAGTVVEPGNRQAGRTRPTRTSHSLESEIYRSKLYPDSLRGRR